MLKLFSTIILLILSLTYTLASTRVINIEYLSVDEGLSHYTINSIYQDELDFIWVGTQDGLNRYDGHKFEVFKPGKDNSIGLHENNIRKICGDHKGHIFIKGMESITLYDMKSATFSTIKEGIVRDIFNDGQHLWYASTHTIYRWNKDENTFVKVFDFDYYEVKNIIIDHFLIARNGDICIQTSNKGFYRINEKGHIVQHFDTAISNSIFEDSKDNIWIGTRNNGVFMCTPFGDIKHYEIGRAHV